jgi:hypothetical protein
LGMGWSSSARRREAVARQLQAADFGAAGVTGRGRGRLPGSSETPHGATPRPDRRSKRSSAASRSSRRIGVRIIGSISVCPASCGSPRFVGGRCGLALGPTVERAAGAAGSVHPAPSLAPRAAPVAVRHNPTTVFALRGARPDRVRRRPCAPAAAAHRGGRAAPLCRPRRASGSGYLP